MVEVLEVVEVVEVVEEVEVVYPMINVCVSSFCEDESRALGHRQTC